MIFVIFCMILYIIFNIHSINIVDLDDGIYIVWCTEKFDSDFLPYTRTNRLKIWKKGWKK